MNLTNILTRKDPLKKAFVTLEDGMTDVLNEEFMLPPEPEPTPQDTGEVADEFDAAFTADSNDGDLAATMPAFDDETPDRLTPHTQNRFAGFTAFNDARNTTQDELNRIGSALASIAASNHLSREFISDCHADIHRANELEMANAAYSAENRQLGDRVERLEKLRSRYDQLIEVLKRRESKLLQEAEILRDSLGAVKLEAVEAKNAVARTESLHGELHASLAAKTNEAERSMRENEMLREKNVGLTLDLDMSLKKQAESRRKYEELSSIYTHESALFAKMTAKLAGEEQEVARLHKLNDAIAASLVEANENAANLTHEMNDREKRCQSEIHSLKSEIQALNSRLHSSTAEQVEAASELTALKTRLNDSESEKQIAEKKYAGLAMEVENERIRHASGAGLSAGESSDQHEAQAEAMRQEIVELTETVGRLRQHENIDAAAKHRAKPKNGFARSLPKAARA